MKNKIISAKANAKVNLALHVIGQRSDGLHLLDSIVAFPEYGDELFFEEADELSLSISGPYGNQLSKETTDASNLIIRAVKLLRDKNNGVAIKLIKNLPIAAGIGGGSSNAAITLKTLSMLWKEKMPKLTDILDLGADLPVCLSNELQRIQGIGEIRTELTKPSPMWIVLANPGIKIPTAKIFGLLRSKENGKLEPLLDTTDQDSFFRYLNRQRNDLEIVTCDLFPEVRKLLHTINDTSNCKLSRMSGSGATCFGLYTEKNHALQAKEMIENCFSKAWVVSASLFLANPSHDIVC